jgi:hypothetical protein
VNKRRLARPATRRFEQVDRANRIRIKIVEGDLSGAVVRRLGRGMNYYPWPRGLEQSENFFSVSNINTVMLVSWDILA